jgi:hypothetical protein
MLYNKCGIRPMNMILNLVQPKNMVHNNNSITKFSKLDIKIRKMIKSTTI